MQTINVNQLRALGVCEDQINRFADLFGELGEVARAVEHLLPPQLREEYQHVVALAQAEYDNIVDPAREEYHRVGAAAASESKYPRNTA